MDDIIFIDHAFYPLLNINIKEKVPGEKAKVTKVAKVRFLEWGVNLFTVLLSK
jgi:hypothetical protein